MAKVSVKAVARSAKAFDAKARAATTDSFQNFALGLGIGTQNPSTFNGYGFNPISRSRSQLEWMWRGSWVCGAAIDTVANDMTRAGVELKGQFAPDDVRAIEESAITLQIWPRINYAIKCARVYGGAIAVLLIDGQDYSKPLRLETVGKGQFRGLIVLDRWMIMPSLGDLVTEIGPELGRPKYYTVESSAPALRGQKIHHTRCLRLIGDELPYWQAVGENLWGMSVLERIFDRLTGFDSATAGASQLLSKSYLRYMKIKDYRKIMAMGGPALNGLQQQMLTMRNVASNEGIGLMDVEDEIETTQASVFSGMSEVLLQLGQQISGALQIPLVRLFGQSPAGLNSSGDSDLRTYYDGILQRQEIDLRVMVTVIYRCIAQSQRINVADGLSIAFRPLWQLDELGKANVAQTITSSVLAAKEANIISDQLALRELQSCAKMTGVWGHVTDEDVAAASDEVLPPVPDAAEADAPLPDDPKSDVVSEKQIERKEKREEGEETA